MKKIISMLLVIAMMITVLTVGIATTNAAETATITIYGLDGTTEVKEFNVGDEFTVYTTLNVSSSVANGKIASVQGTQTYTSGVLTLVDEISGQYGEFADPVKVFPVTGDVTVANAAQDGKIVYNASDPAADGGFSFDSESSQLIVTTYKVKAAGSGEVKNVVKNLAAADSDLTRIIFEGQVQEGKSVAGKATFTDPTPAIDHAEVRVHSLNGSVETMSFNIGDTFNVYTTLDASSVNNGKMASINGTQRYTSTVLQLADTVDADGYITDTDKVFPIMKDGAIGSAKDAGSVKFVGSSTSGFEFNDAKDQLIVTTYRVTANGYADITNKLNILAAADEDITRLVFNGEIQNGASFLMPASFSTDGPVPTLPPQPPTQAPTQPSTQAPTQPSTQPATQPASKLNVTIINPDNTKSEKSFNVGDTFTVYTVLNAGTTIASVDGTQTYPTSQLQLTDQVTGEYHEIVNTAAMFPILGDEAVASVNNGSLQFNASRGTIGGGFAFNTDTSKLIVTNYKVLATGDATIKTTLKTLIKDDDAATKIVFNGATQSGQSYSMTGTFTDPGSVTPTQPATQAPTQPATQAPTQPATQPQNKAVVTIYGIDGTSSTKTFDIGAEFTVYTTLDGSQLEGIHGFASISASQTFTDSVLQSTDEVDELDAVIDTTTMFPIIGSNAVAHIADGENKYNSSTSGVNRGFVFANEDALLAVTHYKVVAAGTAEIRNSISYLAADNSALTRIVNKGVLQPGYTLGGYASFYEPGTEPPTEPATQAPTEPATQAPTQPPTQKPTEAPTQPPTQKPTEAPTQPATEPQSKATVTIYGIDGTSEVKTYNVGDTFTVYTTFDASSAAANGMIASINATQSFTKSILQSTDSVDSEGIVNDVNAMFPILGSRAIARIYDGLNQYNASTPNIGNGFKFDSDKALLIVTNYKVIAAGDAEVRNALITVGAADESLTRIVNNGVVAEGKVIGGKASFTKPTQPDTPTQPSTEPAEGYVLGDADNDGLVTSMDVTIIQRLRAKMTVSVPVEIIERNGDVDGDGVLTVMDATFIQRKLAKMTVEYPIGEFITI